MAIPTSRTNENATIFINFDKCIGCKKCVEICDNFSFDFDNKKAIISNNSLFGCFACGHCMAICNNNAIEISGRTLSKNDIFEIDNRDKLPKYEQILALYQNRRSIRNFKNKPIEKENIEKIINAASFSPMGLPPSDVNLLVFDTVEKSRKFVENYCKYLDEMKWFVSKWFLLFVRVFMGKANHSMFKNFIKPVFDAYTTNIKDNKNVVTYDAPLVIYFYASPYSDPADPIIAATSAMYAAETLGISNIMLGAIHPMIQNGKKSKKI